MDQVPPEGSPPLPPPPPPQTEPSARDVGTPSVQLATPIRRLGARLLDGIIVGVPASIVFGIWSQESLRDGRLGSDELFTLTLIVGAIGAIYEIGLIHLRGQTVGKMAVGVRVVQVEDGRSPSWNRASIRYAVPVLAQFVPVFGGIAYLLVVLWMLWDPRRQGLHDKAARTLVVMA